MEALKKTMNVIDRVFEFIEKNVTGFAVIVFTFAIFANVVDRKLFGNSITWAEELSRYLNIVVVFIGISAGVKFDAHIGVDAVEALLVPKKYHKYMDVIRFVITLIFVIISAYLGLKMSMSMKGLGQKSAAMMLPLWVPYMALPIGFLMAAIRMLMKIIHLLIDKADDGKEAVVQ